jgi:two-component system alkaline phosphatase synthesis response regulator PhoP
MKDVKILVVDDEPDILEILTDNLKKEGYQDYPASNGDEAVKKATEIAPTLIILDIMMPQMDGVEVCRTIRSNQELDQVLIAFLTAREEDYSQIAALDVGGDDYITKPIKPRVLMSRVKALLRRKGRISESSEETHIIKMGNLIVDKESVTVKKGDRTIDLAKKEFQLLSLLISKPGKVCTREEIFNKVWGTDVIVGNRTIDVHIRKLREKIGDSYIKTIKGIGYRFEF